jgi:hypothetical protein
MGQDDDDHYDTNLDIRNPDFVSPEKASEPDQERYSEAFAEDRAADAEKLFLRIERHKTKLWKDYLELAAILADIAEVALFLSGANDREGGKYNAAIVRLLASRAPKLANAKFKTLRNSLINIHRHLPDLTAWRADWTENRKQRWLSPITVRAGYKRERLDAPKERKRADEADKQREAFVRRAAETVEEKELENRRLRVNALLDCDNAEIVALIRETRSDEDVADIIARLQEGRPAPVAAGWPLVVRPAAEDEAEEAPE